MYIQVYISCIYIFVRIYNIYTYGLDYIRIYVSNS